MALTQSDWTVKSVGGNKKLLVATCSVTATTSENDAYTKKTPPELDPTKPWTLVVKTSAASDNVALPVDLWIGYGDDFVLSGNDSAVAATNGAKFKQITDDVGYSAASLAVFLMDPQSVVADVVTIAAIASGYKVKVPVAPYYAINFNGAGALLAHTATYTIIQ